MTQATRVDRFDHPLLHVPLQGTTVIEASAGTGKTWTITGLYLRLLAERSLEPNSILVVTFTNAATAELKERVRNRLQALRVALDTGASNDPLAAELIGRTSDVEGLRRRVALAVETFDEAAIHTIHGFCQRILADHAFESASPFEAEIAPDASILAEVAQDFWRREMQDIDAVWASYLVQRNRGPEALAAEAAGLLSSERLHVVGPSVDDPSAVRTAFVEAFLAAQSVWLAERDRIEVLLAESGVLNASTYKKDSIRFWCARLDDYFAASVGNCVVPEHLDRFTRPSILDKTNKGKAVPRHRFFEQAEVLIERARACERALADAWIGLVARFADQAGEAIERRKLELRVQSYDDLLQRVHRALDADRDGTLTRAIAERYQAALVDEFQDTDDVQYSILRRLFAQRERALFLVGDPKQAIYGFRGADVFTYLRARNDATDRVALDVNRRSTPALVGALNVLFGRTGAPFAMDRIDYPRAEALADYAEVCELGEPRAPLSIWYVPGTFGKGEAENKGALRVRAARATADDIARLLAQSQAGGASLLIESERRALHGGDIAVIVRQHSEADLVRTALAGHGIACVTFGLESVFASREAVELAQVLGAIAKPSDERLVRGALAGVLFGRSAAELAMLAADPVAWEAALARFRALSLQLREHGVARALQTIIEHEQVAARLLAYLDGERQLTNYRHLIELLHAASMERGLDTIGLARFLARAIAEPPQVDDAAQIRLESDERLVRVITIHAAKGLEFPIVYCPFLWDARQESARPPVRFHARDADHTPSLDLGSVELSTHQALAAEEDFAEQLRLAYVALTRAKHHCTIVWGAAKQGARSALAWLLHGPAERPNDIAAERDALETRLRQLSADALRAEVAALADQSGGSIDVAVLADELSDERRADPAERPPGRSAVFSGVVPAPQRTTSFTALHAGIDLDAPDHDAFVRTIATDTAPPPDGALEFPRGAAAGSALHAVFERAMQHAGSFASISSVTLAEWAKAALVAHGLSDRNHPAVVELVRHAMNAGIDHDEAYALAKIAPDRRLVELEFQFALRGVEGAEPIWAPLALAIDGHRAERGLPPVGTPVAIGARAAAFMKGFVDLVFERAGRYYVVDYKSNWLGATPDHYAQPLLAGAIAAEHYDLQYLLYTLAVDRWLASRLAPYDYDAHFGGVYYLFVRGMRSGGEPGQGVYFARPSRTTIEQLRQMVALSEPR